MSHSSAEHGAVNREEVLVTVRVREGLEAGLNGGVSKAFLCLVYIGPLQEWLFHVVH